MSDDYTIDCPRCGYGVEVFIDEFPEGSGTVTCDGCGAEIEYQYSTSVEITDVSIVDTPPVEIECPVCNSTMEFGDVEDETGSEGITCDNCNADISFTWSDWGADVVIDNVDEAETEEDEEEEEDDDDL
jgi:transcription elongation factor Elf1